MANRMGPNDWRSATPVSDDGHVAYVQDVNIAGATGSVTIDVAAGDFSGLGNANATAYTDTDGSSDGTVVGISKGEYVQLAALNAAIGATDDAAWNGVAADASVISLLKAIALNTV